MGYNLLVNGIHWGYNPLTNHLLASWDIQVYFLKYVLRHLRLELKTDVSSFHLRDLSWMYNDDTLSLQIAIQRVSLRTKSL